MERTHSERRGGGEAEEEHKHVATIQRANAGESVTGLITSLITTRPAQSALILASVSIQEGCIVDGFRETVAQPRSPPLSLSLSAHPRGKLVSRIEHRVQFVATERERGREAGRGSGDAAAPTASYTANVVADTVARNYTY